MKRAIAKGAAWMVVAKLTERSLGIVSTLILARLLAPADFGVVAMAMSVIALIELATAFGFELALIQRQNPTKEHYDTAWTLNVTLGTSCAIVTAALAYPAALFFGEPRLVMVMVALAGSWAIQSFENIGVVDFRRKLEFWREFRFLASKKFAGFAVTVALGLLLQSYWALVAGTISGRIAGVVLSYRMHPYRPSFGLAARRDLFSFSSWLFVTGILNFLENRLAHFVVGRLHGPAALGAYTVASEVACLPSTELIAPINRAVFPGYSRMTGNLGELRQGFIDVIAVIAIVAVPASVGVAAIADPLVRTLFGDKWIQAVGLIQILALNGGIQALASNHYSAYLALGRTRLQVIVGTVHVVTLIPLMLFLSRSLGLTGAAYAELGASVLSIAVSYAILLRVLKLPAHTYLAVLWRPILAAVVMGFCVDWAIRDLSVRFSSILPVWQLAISIPLGIVVYAVVLALFWFLAARPRGAESFLQERLAHFIRLPRRVGG
jgi:lipopolysaccharide exporter